MLVLIGIFVPRGVQLSFSDRGKKKIPSEEEE
jgi:hypothetical protein